MTKRNAGWLLAMGMALAAAGCATLNPPRSDAEVVKAKAQARWEAMVKNDFKAAYQYVSPAGKSLFSEEAFANGFARDFWTDAKVQKVECPSSELCEVDMFIEYKFQGRAMHSPLREKWVKQDSDWWYLLER